MSEANLEVRVRAAWDFDDPVGSATRFETHRAKSRTAGERAVWQTQIARAYGLQHRFNQADAVLDAIPLEGLGLHAQARIAIERGRVLNSSGDPGPAVPLFGSAYELARAAGEVGLAVDALHMTAIALGAAGDVLGSDAANTSALELATASTDPIAAAWIPALLNNLGWSRHDAGAYGEALALFERALAVRRTDGSSAQPLLIAEWAVARTLRSLGRYEEALAIQLRLAAQPEGADDSYVAEEIAACRDALAP